MSPLSAFTNDGQTDIAMATSVHLRPFRPGDLEAAQRLSSELRWPHRLEDWQSALVHGAGIVAERDGRLVGTALRWLWGNDRASVGLVLVSPALQRQRIGRRLMAALLADIGRRHVLVHAAEPGQLLCEKLGFRRAGQVCRHEGFARQAASPALAHGERLRPLAREDVETLVALDMKAAGLPRGPVVRRLLSDEQVVVFDRDGRPAGYSVLRRFGGGLAIGPVVAPDVASARALIGYWCRLHQGKFLRIDVDAESGMPPWLEHLGLKQAGNSTAMVRGKLPPRGPACGGWALIGQGMG